MKLLPKPAVALAYGEPWRGKHGAIVSDQRGAGHPSERPGDRAYYGGTLIAESVGARNAVRAADCVNFCAGVDFKPGHAYVGGLADLLDALELLHKEMGEPEIPVTGRYSRQRYEFWSDIDNLLRQFGRDHMSRQPRREVGPA
jgi:hypothetical protein